mgnify:CR=1 FL=1
MGRASLSLEELAKRLVSFNTVSPHASTRGIADFISEYLEHNGFKINQYPYRSGGVEKVNLIATKGGEECKLALSGHLDTVEPKKEWRTDPFKLTLINDRYYGLGITDMKLFLAIAMKAGEIIEEKELRYPFALYFTSDEEIGCLGAKKLIRENIHLAKWIVIGEPTKLIPINLHKGYLYLVVEIFGKGGHSSDPRRGRNVIELGLPPVLATLNRLKKELETIIDRRFDPPYPTMNIGVLTTGEGASKNTIADYCQIHLEVRPLPGQDIEEIYEIFNYMIRKSVEDIEGIQARVRYNRAPTLPLETPKESIFVRVVEKIAGEKVGAVCYNTEGGIFNAAGSQTIIWGPGDIRQAHKANEFAHICWFREEIVDKYVKLIRQICC